MNTERYRTARNNLYLNLVRSVIRTMVPFLGQPVTPESTKRLSRATRGFVTTSRKMAQDIAYRDYLEFINREDPRPKLELHRFTEELWDAATEKAIEERESFTPDVAEQLALSADYWARDAEWGQRVDVAKNDDRIERVARVDFRPPTCPFCTMLNSRGAVYLSAESGARTLHTGDTCTLIFVAVGDEDYPGKESTDIALDRYKKAVEKLGEEGLPANTSNVLKALKEQEPDLPMGVIRRTAETASKEASDNAVRDAKSKLAALEKMNPRSSSARATRDEAIARYQKTLEVLETD